MKVTPFDLPPGPGPSESSSVDQQVVLSVEDVSKQFDEPGEPLAVLRDINFSLKRKSVLSLVGPTGCGKSTLLRIITGLDAPSNGTVTLSHVSSAMGIVFQQHTLLAWRNLYENVRLPLELAGNDSRESHAEIKHVINAVGLSGFEEYLPRRMSGGMQARASLARALVQRPSILLLDEPFASIDEIRRATMYELLIRLFKQYETSSILVTHSLAEAALLSDAVIVLSSRPASIVGTVDITMPKEKRLITPDHDELVTARTEIRRLLRQGASIGAAS